MRRILLLLSLIGLASIPTHGAALADAKRDPEALLQDALAPWTGDFDGVKERGFLRIAIPYNPLFMAFDGDKRIGLAVEVERELEAFLLKQHKARIAVVLMPKARDAIIPAVVSGRADVAVANLTITAERAKEIDFTNPTRKNVSELVVTGPSAPSVTTLDDLVETGLSLRKSSSYYVHLQELNDRRRAEGEEPIPVTEMDETLEDYDLIEMVQSGILSATIVDQHKAEFWARVYDGITVHQDLAIHTGGEIAWALRKDTPDLMAVMNAFVATVRQGTLLGNVIANRYFGRTDWVERIDSSEALKRAQALILFFKTFASEYNLDPRLLISQGYQESRLDQSKRSKRGAIGVMQVLPSTAKDKSVGIPDITDAENNIHAGVRYLRFLRDRYFSDEAIAPLDQVMFGLAAYNAGPANIAKARKRAETMGLDPNVWFGNVEIAAGKSISREPVIYVRNIYKYSVAYALLEDLWRLRNEAVTPN